jgi:hypothetical protein
MRGWCWVLSSVLTLFYQKPKTTSKVIKSKPLPKRKIFPFNSLPAELKNFIYILTLTDPNGISLTATRNDYCRVVQRANPIDEDGRSKDLLESGRHTLVPNLLALNHQIFNEAQHILYGKNTFAVENTCVLYTFLASIGPRNVAVLTDVVIKGWSFSKVQKTLSHPAFTMLASAVNLRHLEIDFTTYRGRSSENVGKNVARQLYRDGHHWFEVMGAAKGKFDAGLDIVKLRGLDFSDPSTSNLSYERTMEVFCKELRKLLRR